MRRRTAWTVFSVWCVLATAWGQESDTASSLPLALVQTGEFDPNRKDLKGIAFDSKDNLYVAGETGVSVFDPSGSLLREMRTESPARCVTVGLDGRVYVGLRTSIVVFDPEGRQVAAWGEKGREPGQFLFITSIALSGSQLYVADAGNRCIHRYAIDGDYADDLRGFNIPSPYFDCVTDRDGVLYVAHTAKHQVERYDANWKKLGAWGEFGTNPEGFSGCCNPTNIALLSEGRIATTEKGIPRFKVYDAEGRMLAYVGPEAFPQAAAGMDLAVDSRGRLALLEPVESKIRFYVLTAAPVRPQASPRP
ncbi:NHL repeat-containing protein [Candidatus Sumerlaeota bacterium]|nr:NHL repeat-containing protein [Candidatus Sumerlaeota bacterium]